MHVDVSAKKLIILSPSVIQPAHVYPLIESHVCLGFFTSLPNSSPPLGPRLSEIQSSVRVQPRRVQNPTYCHCRGIGSSELALTPSLLPHPAPPSPPPFRPSRRARPPVTVASSPTSLLPPLLPWRAASTRSYAACRGCACRDAAAPRRHPENE